MKKYENDIFVTHVRKSQGWCFFMHRITILVSGWYWADTERPYQIGIGTILNAHVSKSGLVHPLIILFLSGIPLLLSVWTIDLAFVWVLHILLLFFVKSCFSCVYLCTWAVRELTLLFSHLQRQRNTKKVLNSYQTLLSGLWPYSSPYLSGDRYAPCHIHTASLYIQTGG